MMGEGGGGLQSLVSSIENEWLSSHEHPLYSTWKYLRTLWFGDSVVVCMRMRCGEGGSYWSSWILSR